jgi:putative ABC transport system permease protein
VKDFKFNSLHHKVTSLSIVCQPEWGYAELSILMNGKNINESLASIKSIWTRTVPSLPFSYSFLDDHFEKLYKQDTQLGRVVQIMAVLSVLISCMGLFALTAIITGKRTKEIAIRKVLGASEWQIVNILSKNFIMLVVLSFALTTPVTYYVLIEWLSTFAYHTNVDPYYFLLGGSMAIVLAFLTTSVHTIKTARSNPVNSLKNE